MDNSKTESKDSFGCWTNERGDKFLANGQGGVLLREIKDTDEGRGKAYWQESFYVYGNGMITHPYFVPGHPPESLTRMSPEVAYEFLSQYCLSLTAELEEARNKNGTLNELVERRDRKIRSLELSMPKSEEVTSNNG